MNAAQLKRPGLAGRPVFTTTERENEMPETTPTPPQISERSAFYIIWIIAGIVAITLASFDPNWVVWIVTQAVVIGLTRGVLRFLGRSL